MCVWTFDLSQRKRKGNAKRFMDLKLLEITVHLSMSVYGVSVYIYLYVFKDVPLLFINKWLSNSRSLFFYHFYFPSPFVFSLVFFLFIAYISIEWLKLIVEKPFKDNKKYLLWLLSSLLLSVLLLPFTVLSSFTTSEDSHTNTHVSFLIMC